MSISTKLQQMGWKCKHTLREGLIKTYEWYLNVILKAKEDD